MKKVSLLALMIVAGVGANAEVSNYASFKVGYTQSNSMMQHKNENVKKGDMNKPAANFSVAYGMKFGEIRSDLEYTYNTPAKKDKAKVKNMSLMLNGYYDVMTGSEWTPYVQAGLGVARVKLEPNDLAKAKFGWQVGTGVAYAVDSNVSIDVGYRFAGFGKVESEKKLGKDNKVRVRTHSFTLGAKIGF